MLQYAFRTVQEKKGLLLGNMAEVIDRSVSKDKPNPQNSFDHLIFGVHIFIKIDIFRIVAQKSIEKVSRFVSLLLESPLKDFGNI